MRVPRFKSFRQRYLLMSIVLVGLLLAMAFLAQRDVSKSQQLASVDLSHRVQLLDDIRNIRINILDAYRNLNAFLLEPDKIQYRDLLITDLSEAIGLSQSMHSKLESKQSGLISDDLNKMLTVARELVDVRGDRFRLYPSLAIGNTRLQPTRRKVNSAFSTIFSEMELSGFHLKRPDIFNELVKMRHLWQSLLSTFRLYLANRIGSFDIKALRAQENAISTTMATLQSNIKTLLASDKVNDVSFEVEAAIVIAQEHIQGWNAAYKEVVKIHRGEGWRIDTVILKQNISPLIESVTARLTEIERDLVQSAGLSMSSLEQTSARQNQVLWIVAVTGVLFILFAYLAVERNLLRPVANVTRALKEYAFGHEPVNLPPVQHQETRNLVDAFSEMNRQIHMRQLDLEHQATHDMLTSLPNRILLDDRIAHAISLSSRSEKPFSLLVLDLDNFKEVNDTLGHHVGDALLKDVSERLQEVLRDSDTVARLGGDEFAILIQDCDEKMAVNIAAKIQQSFEATCQVNELTLYISASIGIATHPKHGADAHALLQHADVAMYRAKQNHLDYFIYDEKDNEFTLQRLELSNALRSKMEQDDLELYYQPKFDLASGKVNCAEALLRWPDTGALTPVMPDKLIALAEETGHIKQLTRWVLDKSIQQCAVWNKSGMDISVSVNLSVFSLRDPDLISYIRKTLKRYALDPSRLCLEITESAMMANPLHAIETLKKLNDMGIALAIDDFGTGFSSLAYLKQLPVDEIKIDKSFVMNMVRDGNDEVIVKSTVDLGHNLGMRVTAEGVETEATWLRLADMGCDAIQGFYMSRPLPAHAFMPWIRQAEKRQHNA